MSKSLISLLYCSLNNSSNITEYKSQHYRPVKMNSLSLGKPVSNNMVDCALFTSDTVPSAFCSPVIHQTKVIVISNHMHILRYYFLVVKQCHTYPNVMCWKLLDALFPQHFQPTVLTVALMLQCCVCRLSVCDVMYCG